MQFKDGAIHDLAGRIAADGCISSSDGASSGIVGLLQVCESCFSTSFPKMKTAEESAISTCETDTKQNEIEKATKEQDVKYKTKEAASLDNSVAKTKTAEESAISPTWPGQGCTTPGVVGCFFSVIMVHQ